MNIDLTNLWVDEVSRALNRLSNENNFIRTCSITTNRREIAIGKKFKKGRAIDETIDVIQLDVFVLNRQLYRISILCEDIPEHIIAYKTYHYLREQFDKIIELEVEKMWLV